MSLFSFLFPHHRHRISQQKDRENPSSSLNICFPTCEVAVKDLPFTPTETEVIYVQEEGDDAVNDYIRTHLDSLQEIFANMALRFVYLPALNDEIAHTKEICTYWKPSGKSHPLLVKAKALSNSFLLDYMCHKENRQDVSSPAVWRLIPPEFLSEHDRNAGHYVFKRIELHAPLYNTPTYYETLSRKCFFETDSPRYRLARLNSADESFEKESKELFQKAKMLINKMRCIGVSEMVIASLLEPETEPSHLRITSDNRIFLSDFDDKEIKMTPLVKAVFFLFLRHHEGIAFKELSDYADELAGLYDAIRDGKTTNREFNTPKRLNRSIQNLIDPFNNSINEKCARIREAFLICIHEQIAKHYIVLGKRGEPKHIPLSQDKIIWE